MQFKRLHEYTSRTALSLDVNKIHMQLNRERVLWWKVAYQVESLQMLAQ